MESKVLSACVFFKSVRFSAQYTYTVPVFLKKTVGEIPTVKKTIQYPLVNRNAQCAEKHLRHIPERAGGEPITPVVPWGLAGPKLYGPVLQS